MNHRLQELQKKQARMPSWRRLRNEPWRVTSFGRERAFGSGIPRVQLIQTGFCRSLFWEVCELESEWVLYTAKLVECSDWKVQGYDRTGFESDRLKTYFERLTTLSLPIAPRLDGSYGCDGAVTELTLFGDTWSQSCFHWWSVHPPQWTPLVTIAHEMLVAFETVWDSSEMWKWVRPDM